MKGQPNLEYSMHVDTAYGRSVQPAAAILFAALLAGCSSGDDGDDAPASAGPVSITTAQAVINSGTHFSMSYTSVVKATDARGAPALLEAVRFSSPTYVDIPSTTTFSLNSTSSPGTYQLFVSKQVGGTSGLPVAVAGSSLDLTDRIYYQTPNGVRLEISVPMRIHCDQPAYQGSERCQSGGSPSGGAPSGGTTSGQGTTRPAAPGDATSRGFISWNGNNNGEVVLDANNEHFKFYRDTGCLFSLQRQEETSNFCLLGPSTYQANFAGMSVHVRSAAGQQGGCVAVLTHGVSENLIDIATVNGVQTARETSTRPNPC